MPIYGFDWATKRYASCDFWTGTIWDELDEAGKSRLLKKLQTPIRRPKYMLGKYERNNVPNSYREWISPLSTPWGYALPRVFIEGLGGHGNGTLEGLLNTTDSLDKTIASIDGRSTNQIEFLVDFAENVVEQGVNPQALLSHILPQELLEESNPVKWFKEIEATIEARAPKLWGTYFEMGKYEKMQLGIAIF